jgi:DNA-binding transcriptional regulator YhcF (GntR family)
MEFDSHKSIYLQIAENICNQILKGELPLGKRAPSVRVLAVELEVNRNTVMRTFTHLQNEEILINKRGVGFFVAEDSIQKILENEKDTFFNKELPYLIERIQLLKLNTTDLQELITSIKNND